MFELKNRDEIVEQLASKIYGLSSEMRNYPTAVYAQIGADGTATLGEVKLPSRNNRAGKNRWNLYLDCPHYEEKPHVAPFDELVRFARDLVSDFEYQVEHNELWCCQ